MGFFEGWINEQAIKDGYPFPIVGILGAILNAMKQKLKWKGYVKGIIAGTLISSVLTFIIGPSNVPTFFLGIVCFASGVAWPKFVDMLAKSGTTKTDKLLNPKEDGRDDDSHENS